MERAPLKDVQQADTVQPKSPVKMTPEKVFDRAAAAAAAKLLNSAKKSQTKKQAKKTKLSLKRSVSVAGKKHLPRLLALSTDSSLNDTVEFKGCPSFRSVPSKRKRDGGADDKPAKKTEAFSALCVVSECGEYVSKRESTYKDCGTLVKHSEQGTGRSWTGIKSPVKTRRCSVSIERLELSDMLTSSNKCNDQRASSSKHLNSNALKAKTCSPTALNLAGLLPPSTHLSGGRCGTSGVKDLPFKSEMNTKHKPHSQSEKNTHKVDSRAARFSIDDGTGDEVSLSQSFHTCCVCGEFCPRGHFVRHMQQCIAQNSQQQEPPVLEAESTATGRCEKAITEDDVEMEKDALATEYTFCQLCQKDLSHLNSHRRTLHINRCIDKEEARKKEEGERRQALEAAKKQVLNCPMCGKVLRTNQSCKVHLKTCAQSLGVGTEQLLKLVNQQKEEHEARIAAGILPPSFRPKRQQGQQRQGGTSGQRNRLQSAPKSKLEEDTQLALALSSSLNLEAVETASAASSTSTGGDGTTRRGRKQLQEQDYLLNQLTSSQAATRISSRVSDLIMQQDPEDDSDILPALPAVCKDRLQRDGVRCIHLSSANGLSPKDKTFWRRTSLDHNGETASQENSDLRHQFYVPVLMPPVELSTVTAGSKVRRMSEIPGRRRSFDGKAEEEDEDEESSMSEEESVPVPSTQTAALLAEMAAENDDVYSQARSSQQRRVSASHTVEDSGLVAAYAGLVNCPDYSDVHIKAADGVTLFAHKVILFARCPMLLQLAEEGCGNLDLLNWSSDCILAVLRYVYAGATDFDSDILQSVLSLADRLCLPGLNALAAGLPSTSSQKTPEGHDGHRHRLSSSQSKKHSADSTVGKTHITEDEHCYMVQTRDTSVDQSQIVVNYTSNNSQAAAEVAQTMRKPLQFASEMEENAGLCEDGKNSPSPLKKANIVDEKNETLCSDNKNQKLCQDNTAEVTVVDTKDADKEEQVGTEMDDAMPALLDMDFNNIGSSFESEKSLQYEHREKEVQKPVSSQPNIGVTMVAAGPQAGTETFSSSEDREEGKKMCTSSLKHGMAASHFHLTSQGEHSSQDRGRQGQTNNSQKSASPDFEDDDSVLIAVDDDICDNLGTRTPVHGSPKVSSYLPAVRDPVLTESCAEKDKMVSLPLKNDAMEDFFSQEDYVIEDEVELLKIEDHEHNPLQQGVEMDPVTSMAELSPKYDSSDSLPDVMEVVSKTDTEAMNREEVTSVASDDDLFEDDIDVSLLPSTQQALASARQISLRNVNKGNMTSGGDAHVNPFSHLVQSTRKSGGHDEVRRINSEKTHAGHERQNRSSGASESPNSHSQRSYKRKSSETEDAISDRDTSYISPDSGSLPRKRRQIVSTSERNYPSFSVSAVESSHQMTCLSSPSVRKFKTSTPQHGDTQTSRAAKNNPVHKIDIDRKSRNEEALKPHQATVSELERFSDVQNILYTDARNISACTTSGVHRNITHVTETLSSTTPNVARSGNVIDSVSVVEHDSLYVTPVVAPNETRRTFQLVTPNEATKHGRTGFSCLEQNQNQSSAILSSRLQKESCGYEVEKRTYHGQKVNRDESMDEQKINVPVSDYIDAVPSLSGEFSSAEEGEKRSMEQNRAENSDSDIEIVDTSFQDIHPPSPNFSAKSKPSSSQSNSRSQPTNQSVSHRLSPSHLECSHSSPDQSPPHLQCSGLPASQRSPANESPPVLQPSDFDDESPPELHLSNEPAVPNPHHRESPPVLQPSPPQLQLSNETAPQESCIDSSPPKLEESPRCDWSLATHSPRKSPHGDWSPARHASRKLLSADRSPAFHQPVESPSPPLSPPLHHSGKSPHPNRGGDFPECSHDSDREGDLQGWCNDSEKSLPHLQPLSRPHSPQNHSESQSRFSQRVMGEEEEAVSISSSGSSGGSSLVMMEDDEEHGAEELNDSPGAEPVEDVWEGFEDADAFSMGLMLDQPDSGDKSDDENQTVSRPAVGNSPSTLTPAMVRTRTPSHKTPEKNVPLQQSNTPDHTPVTSRPAPDTPTRSLVRLARQMRQHFAAVECKSRQALHTRFGEKADHKKTGEVCRETGQSSSEVTGSRGTAESRQTVSSNDARTVGRHKSSGTNKTSSPRTESSGTTGLVGLRTHDSTHKVSRSADCESFKTVGHGTPRTHESSRTSGRVSSRTFGKQSHDRHPEGSRAIDHGSPRTLGKTVHGSPSETSKTSSQGSPKTLGTTVQSSPHSSTKAHHVESHQTIEMSAHSDPRPSKRTITSGLIMDRALTPSPRCSPLFKTPVSESRKTTQESDSFTGSSPILRKVLLSADKASGALPHEHRKSYKTMTSDASHDQGKSWALDSSPYRHRKSTAVSPGKVSAAPKRILTPLGGFVPDENEMDDADVSSLWTEENAPEGEEVMIDKARNVELEPQPQPAPAVTPQEPRRMPVTKAALKAWVLPSPFTPMPAYDNMTTPDLKREVQKFGLKPQGKKRMRVVLKKIYQETHQYETDSDYDGPLNPSPAPATISSTSRDQQTLKSKKAKKPVPTKKTTSKQTKSSASGADTHVTKITKKNSPGEKKSMTSFKARVAGKKTGVSASSGSTGSPQVKSKKTKRGLTSRSKTAAGHCKLKVKLPPFPVRSPNKSAREGDGRRTPPLRREESGSSDCWTSPEKGSVCSSQDSDCSDRPDMSVYEEAGAEDEDITPSQQPSEQDLKQKLMNYIKSRPALHIQVLTYEPLDIEVLRTDLKEAGIKCPQQKLQDFLNEMCITFTTKNMVPQKNRHRGKTRKAPKPKKTAASQEP